MIIKRTVGVFSVRSTGGKDDERWALKVSTRVLPSQPFGSGRLRSRRVSFATLCYYWQAEIKLSGEGDRGYQDWKCGKVSQAIHLGEKLDGLAGLMETIEKCGSFLRIVVPMLLFHLYLATGP